MATSANLKAGGIATYTVKVSGNVIPDAFNAYSIYVENRLNGIPSARITIQDGEPASGDFPASSSATFVPGAEITIEAGYDATNAVIFKGIITGQSIKVNEAIGSCLELLCRDEAVKMTVGRKCLTFSQQKDSDIISSIIGTYPGLSSSVTATSTTLPEQVQYYATDWDFILSRAEANGMIVSVVNGSVTVGKPDANTTPVATIAYGDGLLGFNADLDSTFQLGEVSASTWDYKQQALATGQASNNYAGPGNLSSKKLSGVIGLSDYQLQTSATLETTDLTEWSVAQLIKSGYSKIQGSAKFLGTGLLALANYITLEGLGDRFNGDHLVSGTVHNIADGNWITEISIGLSNTWVTQEPGVVAPPASGLLPGARGLLTGTVKKIFEDPGAQYRILVNVPIFDPNGAGIWARLSNFYATSGAGIFFLPEVGDEVVLGFLNEDPRYPIILGSMYSSSKNKPFNGLEPNGKNSVKAIVSKSGINIQFDDENKVFTITTPGSNQFILSDKDNKITIQDSNSNSIVMSSSGIDINSASNINIKAAGNVTISGMNIKENAQIEFSAQGSAAASVQASGMLTLRGAMVMIN
jgi:Rhs element Vgr protein